jgi:hypothetical protein
MSAVKTATITIMTASSRARLCPASRTRSCPTHAVTPLALRPSLTTNSVAMKITVGSPKPARASFTDRTPVAYSVRAAPTATSSTGSRFQMKRTTTPPSTRKQMMDSLIVLGRVDGSPRRHRRSWDSLESTLGRTLRDRYTRVGWDRTAGVLQPEVVTPGCVSV